MRAARLAASRFSGGGAALRQAVQQGGGEVGQQRGLGFQAGVRRVVIERQRKTARGGGGGASRQDEGEQFQQVEGGAGTQAEAAEGRRGVHQQRRRKVAQVLRGLGGGQEQQFAVRGKDGGTAMTGDNRGGVRQCDACAHRGMGRTEQRWGTTAADPTVITR